MNKIILLLIGILAFNMTNAQRVMKLDEYTALNGITYKVGDEIKLLRGSDTNGNFVYVSVGGRGIIADGESNRLGADLAGQIVTIKKIKRYDQKHYKGVYFSIAAGDVVNYSIDVENAIKTCEIEGCQYSESGPDKYDQLSKIKALLDNGALTEQEFEAEKKKILARND